MVELPPYLKVITGGARRIGADAALGRVPRAVLKSVQGSSQQPITVSVQNPSIAKTKVSPEEAERALGRLQHLLPNSGQRVHELHEFPDRRRILVLLAPLVNGP